MEIRLTFMRTYRYYLFLIILVFLGNFFCSNLPFDYETTLGSGILNDQDSLLTVFDGKICKGFLTIESAESFLDTSDTSRSGLNLLSPVALGAWENERSYAYFKFRADSIKNKINLVKENRKNTLLSFSINFSNDAQKSDSIDYACIEFGYYNSVIKSDAALIDTTKFEEISHLSYNGRVSSSHSIPLNKYYIVKDTTLFDTSTILHIHEKIDIIEWDMVPEIIPIDTINSLYSLGKDTVLIKTIIDTTDITNNVIDTSYVIGIIIDYYLKIVNPADPLGETHIKTTIVYDSIIPYVSFLKEGQSILYANTKTLHTSADSTTIQWDTIITTPDTTTAYKIDSKTIHIISGIDTTEVIQYDTVHILTTIIQDSIFQTATIAPKASFIFSVHDTTLWAVNDTTLSLYARLDSVKSNTLQFIKDVHFNLAYFNDSSNDTITESFYPNYYDYSVFEKDTTSLNTQLLTSGAAGRYTRFKLNLSPIRDIVLGTNDSIQYLNVPKAVLTLFPDSISMHTSTGSSIYARYMLSTINSTNVEDLLYSLNENSEKIPLYKFSPAISTTTDSIDIQLNSYLIDIMHKTQTLPEKIYLYLWLYNGNFAHVSWQNKDLPINFIVSDSQ